MSTMKRAGLTVSMIGLLALVLVQPNAVQAQRRPRPPVMIDSGSDLEDQTFDALTIPEDREATAIIEAAKDYVKKKDWDTVARSLQYLLEKPEDSWFKVKRTDIKGKEYTAKISTRDEANLLIGELPPEGLETYRQKYGQKAMVMLQDGIDRNDTGILSLVAQRYRHTESGVKAIQILGNYFLDRGNYSAASGKFRELLELLEKEKAAVKEAIGAKTFFKAALAAQRFGDAELAAKLWKQLADQVGDKGLTFGKQTYTLEQLRAEFERNAQIGSRNISSVQVVRGDATRTAQGVGSTPYFVPRLAVSMFVPDPSKEKPPDGLPKDTAFLSTAEWVQEKIRSATEMVEKSSSSKRPLMSGFFPIAGNNIVIFRTYDGVYAVYLHDDPTKQQKAGEVAWAQTTEGSLHKLGGQNEGTGLRNTFETWWGQYSGLNGGGGSPMPNILFENSSVGTLSHDNNLVYFVDDLALPPHPILNYTYSNGGSPYGVLTDFVLYNSLRAAELDTGRLKWEIGGRKQGGKVPDMQNNFGGIRVQMGPNGRPIQIGPDGKPIEKPKPPEKPFVLPKELPQTRDFVNASDELLDTFFLGPPLPIGGKIYLLVEFNGEIQLCCINPKRLGKCKVPRVTATNKEPSIPADGPELVWRQPLGTANLKLFQDTMRRIQPSHLAYNDGILVCPTNAGAIVAVNLLTQSLSWAYSYRTNPNEAANGENGMGAQMGGGMGPGFRGGRFRNEFMMMNMGAERWYPAPPAIAGGNVVFAAPDSNAITCLSLRDGQRRWSVNRQPGDLFMAGVYDNKVLIVGKESVRALKLSDGTLAWDHPKAIGMPSGQGVASDGKYYLPCKNGGPDSPDPQIVEINVDTGDMHATKSRRKDVPGNLIFFDGEIISQGITSLSVFPQLQVKLTEMNARLEANPKDPVGLTDRGELHLDKGELAMAIDDLTAALNFKPGPEVRAKARLKLYEALTEQLQQHFDQGEKHLALYKDLCLNEVSGDERLKRQSAYLSILGKGREAQGKLVEAFEAYMEFGQLNGGREMVSSVDQAGTLSRPDVWARGRILAMITNATPQQRKPLEEQIAKEWKKVKESDDTEKMRKFVQLFGSMFSSGLEARLVLAQRLMVSTSQEDQHTAEIYLDILCRQRDSIVMAAEATETMARFMVKKGLLRDAVQLYRTLGTEFKDVKLSGGRTGADIYNELLTDKRFLPYLNVGAQIWDVGMMKGELVSGPFNNMLSTYFNVEPDGDVLPFFHQHRLVIDTQTPTGNGMWQIRLLDRKTGQTKWKYGNLPPNAFLINQGFEFPMAGAPLGGAVRFAQVRGHILMLTMQHMVYAWDLADQKKLWEVNLLGRSVNSQVMETHTDADGTIRLIYSDGTKIRIGQMGLLESSYVCLPTRDGLVGMNPVTGAVLWKHEAPSGVQIFGDTDYIFAVDSNDEGNPTSTIAIRAADGVSVRVPDFSRLFHPPRRVSTLGRNLIVFDEEQGEKVLRCYDALTGKDVWRRTFPAGSSLVRSADHHLAGVVRPDGSLAVYDLAANAVLMHVDSPNGHVGAAMAPFLELCASIGMASDSVDDRIREEHLKNVQEMVLLQDEDSYYIALNKNSEAGVRAFPFVTNGLRSMRLNGTLYRFNKAGRLEWFVEQISNQYLILENFDELPIVIMGSMVQRFNQSQSAEMIAYDKRTGKQISFATKSPRISNNGQFFAMHTDPTRGVIELLRYDLKVRFVPVNGPRPGLSDKDGDRADGNNAPIRTNIRVRAVPANVQMQLVLPAQRIRVVNVQVLPAPPLPAPALPAAVPVAPAQAPAARPAKPADEKSAPAKQSDKPASDKPADKK
jgi:outer membrane protein assembly factor BamB/tetratricopeptide (TPR) repeat protein